MSRRPNPSADRAAQNQQTLKSLVKLEGNKSCADCKKNKHPRWASWNLGIFVCIRCSGIHRGMGTHISRVKSVDLDAWTDEQLQSMLRWGNTRANKYWEAKLATGHVPAEAKIENFIRTKYDSKRWASDGPMPDPSTLDAGDDDAPLNVVQEKAKLDRASSTRNGSTSSQPVVRRHDNNIDLFGDEPARPARPSTTEPALSARPPPVKGPVAPPQTKATKPAESLLGLDFFGGTQSAPPARPSSATSATASGGPQRSDLKQSILSLYASAPKSASAAPSPSASQQFGGMSSAPAQSPLNGTSSAFGGMDDAFSSLSFSSPAPQQPAAKSTFSNLTSPAASMRQTSSPAFPTGGSFFDSKPAPQPAQTTFNQPAATKPRTQRLSSGFGDFGDFTSATPTPSTAKSPPPPATSTMGDLFDMSGPAPSSAPKPTPNPAPKRAEASRQPPPISAASYSQSSAFNLSAPAPVSQSKPAVPQASNFSAISNADPWGSNDAWSTPDPEPVKAPAPPQASVSSLPSTSSYKAPATTSTTDDFGGWGSNAGSTTTPYKAPVTTTMNDDFGGWGSNTGTSQPTVTQDDDFGGWSSASPVATTTQQPTNSTSGQQKSMGGGDDLFANVWE